MKKPILILTLILSVSHYTSPQEKLIIDGERADISELPYTVAFKRKYPKQSPFPDYGSSVCTGVIIDRQWVLTVAHCMYDNDGYPLTVSDFYTNKQLLKKT